MVVIGPSGHNENVKSTAQKLQTKDSTSNWGDTKHSSPKDVSAIKNKESSDSPYPNISEEKSLKIKAYMDKCKNTNKYKMLKKGYTPRMPTISESARFKELDGKYSMFPPSYEGTGFADLSKNKAYAKRNYSKPVPHDFCNRSNRADVDVDEIFSGKVTVSGAFVSIEYEDIGLEIEYKLPDTQVRRVYYEDIDLEVVFNRPDLDKNEIEDDNSAWA